MKVIRSGGCFIGVYQGRDRSNNIKGIGLAHSWDGENWTTTQQPPAFDNTQWNNYDPQGAQGASPGLSQIGGHISIHYGDSEATESRALPYQYADCPMLDQDAQTVYEAQDWFPTDTTWPAVQEIVSDGEYIYLIYMSADNETGGSTTSTGVARADLGVDL
jgi:hypothetical protein